jgi:threonyl-tRNA synthetase
MLCGAKLRSALSFHFRRHYSPFSPPPFPSLLRPRLFSSTMASDHPKDEAYLQKVIPKRIQLFQSIQAKQLAHLQSLSSDPIK